jgi:hypothetical protein
MDHGRRMRWAARSLVAALGLLLVLATTLSAAAEGEPDESYAATVVTSVTVRTADGTAATLEAPRGFGASSDDWCLNSTVTEVLERQGLPTAIYLRRDGSVATLWFGES